MKKDEPKIIIDFDEQKVLARIAAGASNAQKALDIQVLNDSNNYIPVDSGTLKKSGILNTIAGSGKVIWNTPYAKSQYYGLDYDHTKQNNPRACPMWFEMAKTNCLKKWKELVDEYIKRG